MTDDTKEAPSPDLIKTDDRFILFIMDDNGIRAHWRNPSDLEIGHIARMCEDWATRNIRKMPSPTEIRTRPNPILNPFGPN